VTEQQFHIGSVTDGEGRELPDKAYLTFGSEHGTNEGDCDIQISGGRAHEVARRIVATSEMLAALKAIADCYVEQFAGVAVGLNANTPLHRPFEIARAAIAKAEGSAVTSAQRGEKCDPARVGFACWSCGAKPGDLHDPGCGYRAIDANGCVPEHKR
jgi:hypothetical protein